MKSFKKTALVSALALASLASAMDADGWASTYESLSAFDESNLVYGNRPGYVKPIVTNLSTILNSNWVSSANVPQSFAFEAGLPFAIVPITASDREYGDGNPTIFGGNDMTNAGKMATGVCAPEAGFNCPVVNGNESLNGLGVFTYPYLQLAGSFYHARVVFRGMLLPSISELRKFNLFGFGLQYSFGHFFQYMLPRAAQPLDVSLMFGYSTSGIGYQPEDYSGELDLDISAYTINMVIGYKPFAFFEVMMSLGYQAATMESSGHLTNNLNPAQQINPTLTVKGDNGFRFGIEVALQLGSFHPVAGYDYVGKSSFTTNILYFKQTFGKDKSPAEIAKEKAASAPQEESPKAAEQDYSSDESSQESSANDEESASEETSDSEETGESEE